jgi:hypothetical protein
VQVSRSTNCAEEAEDTMLDPPPMSEAVVTSVSKGSYMADRKVARLAELTKIADTLSSDSTQNNRTVSDVSVLIFSNQ